MNKIFNARRLISGLLTTIGVRRKKPRKLQYKSFTPKFRLADSCLSDDLSNLANKWNTDKGTIVPDTETRHGPRLFFTPVYDLFFANVRSKKLNLLEIGIGGGQSLPMWREYFPNADIHAIDVVRFEDPQLEGVSLHQLDQTNRAQLKSLGIEFGPFDVIIDDGGHMMEQQQVSLGILLPYVQPGGLYFIEDLHTSFWPHNGFSDLYGTKLDLRDDKSNSTYSFLMNLMRNGISSSAHLSAEENEQLSRSADKVVVFDLPSTEYGPNRLAMLRRAQGR